MKPTRAYLSAVLILSACGRPNSEVGNNVAANSDEVTLRPGKYEVEFVREVMMPGQPSEPTHEVANQCFSSEDLQHPESIFVPETDDCDQREAKASNGEFSARMVCNLPQYSPSDFVFDVHGTYDAEGAELVGEANLAGATLRETRTFKRQGNC